MANVSFTGYDYLLFDILNERATPRDYSTHRGGLPFTPIDKSRFWLIDGLAIYILGSDGYELLKVTYGLNGYLTRSAYDICQALKISSSEYYYRRGIVMGKLKAKSAMFQAIQSGPGLLTKQKAKIRSDIDIISRVRNALENEIEPDFLIFTNEPRVDCLNADEQILASMLVPLSQLKVSVRTANALRANEMHSLYDIFVYSTKQPIGKMKGMGEKGTTEIRKAAEKFGFCL